MQPRFLFLYKDEGLPVPEILFLLHIKKERRLNGRSVRRVERETGKNFKYCLDL